MDEIKAIDIHGHLGPCNNHGGDLNDQLMSNDIDTIRQRAKKSNIKLTIISALNALMPYSGNPLHGNNEAHEVASKYSDIKMWAVLDPKKSETYKQVENFITSNECVGIKIHPTLHNYKISDYGDDIFSFATSNNITILTHSGCSTNPEDVCLFAEKYKDVKIILAHLGSSEDGKLSRQVYAFKQTKSKNVYIDTSSGCSIYSGLIEWAVSQIGSKRLLFGSDTPLHFTACQKARIEYAEILEDQKYDILFKNASQLFKIEDKND